MEGSYGYVRYQISAKPPGNRFTSLFKASAVAHLKVLQMINIGIPHYNVSNLEFFRLVNLFLLSLFSLWFRVRMKKQFVVAAVPRDH